MNNCFQVTALSWLLLLGQQHLYEIIDIYKKKLTGNTFTKILTLREKNCLWTDLVIHWT